MCDLRAFMEANNLDGAKLMPVPMTPPVPPDNRMAELDALLRRKPQDAPKRQGVPRVAPAYLTGLAVELRARAVARAAHARECRARLRKERNRTRTEKARSAHVAQAGKPSAYERAQVREALANGPASDSTVALEKRFAAFRMLRGMGRP